MKRTIIFWALIAGSVQCAYGMNNDSTLVEANRFLRNISAEQIAFLKTQLDGLFPENKRFIVGTNTLVIGMAKTPRNATSGGFQHRMLTDDKGNTVHVNGLPLAAQISSMNLCPPHTTAADMVAWPE